MAYKRDPKTGKLVYVADDASVIQTEAPKLAATPIFTKPDATSVTGLQEIARRAGGKITDKANAVVNEPKKPGLFTRALDFISRPQYAVTSAIKNVIDKDPTTTFLGGIGGGLSGKQKTTGSEVLAEIGWNPESGAGKFAKGVVGFGLDVLFDPLTYVTFGTAGGVKAAGKALTKEGAELLGKRLAMAEGKNLSRNAIEEAVVNLSKSSPELYAKFIDQGGIKMFGKTIASGAAIGEAIQKVPLMKQVDELTAPVRNTLYALFDKNYDAAVGKLPSEFTSFRQRVGDLAGANQQRAIEGVTNIATANKLNAIESEWVMNALESGTKLADARLENVRGQFEALFARGRKALVAAGKSVGELPNYATHVLIDEDALKAKNLIPKRASRFGGAVDPTKERSILKFTAAAGEEKIGTKTSLNLITTPGGKIVDETGKSYTASQATVAEINGAFGKDFFEKNVVKVAAVYGASVQRAVDTSLMLREAAQKFGVMAERAPTNFIESGIKELKGYKFHPIVARELSNMSKNVAGDEATKNLMRAYDKVQNLWKASVTSMFPAFHGRNGISNVLQNMLDVGSAALSPAKHAISWSLIKHENAARKLTQAITKGGKTAEEARVALQALEAKKILTDFTGKSYSFGELRKLIRDNGVAFNGRYTGYMDIGESVAEQVGHLSKLGKTKKVAAAVLPISQEFLPFKVGFKVGEVIEEQARLLNFVTNLEKTGSATQAAARMKQFLFDYQNLSDFEKKFMKRIMPFYTWPRKNLELQARTLLTTPGKITAQAHLIGNLSNSMLGDDALTEDELALLPDYLRESLSLPVTREGKNLNLLTQLQIPAEQATKFLPGFLSGLNPAIKYALERTTGYSFFRKEQIDETYRYVSKAEYEALPQVVKDYVGFAEHTSKTGNISYSAIDPVRYHLIQSLPAEASIAAVIKEFKKEGTDAKLKVLRFLTGVRTSGEQNLDDLAEQLDWDQKAALQKILLEAGVLKESSYLPKTEKQRLFSN